MSDTIIVKDTKTSGQMIFVNGTLNGQSFSASAHQRFSKDAYDRIMADNLTKGDSISIEWKESGQYKNIVKYLGKIAGAKSQGNPSQSSDSGGSNRVGQFRHPDEIIMGECLMLSNKLVTSLITEDKGNFKKTETFENIKNLVINTAYELYGVIKDPQKDLAIESNRSDISGSSPEPEQRPLPDAVDPDGE